ncbi:hypothetical protein [Streptomyces sp. NPDC020141]|uniref:hypothetical protein n=1 Tax=Streptomyces sp. NPDC020141 TaxID=3365065 RepID=UPI003789D98F
MSGAHVVLLEDDDTGENGIVVTRALVNGVDVGTIAERPRIRLGTSGTDDVTTITLTLVPSQLEVRGALSNGDRREPRAGFAAPVEALGPGG